MGELEARAFMFRLQGRRSSIRMAVRRPREAVETQRRMRIRLNMKRALSESRFRSRSELDN